MQCSNPGRAKHSKKIFRISNPDIPQAGRGGAAHGGAARQNGAGQDMRPKGRSAQETSDPCFLQGVFPGRHEHSKSYANRWKNKTRQ